MTCYDVNDDGFCIQNCLTLCFALFKSKENVFIKSRMLQPYKYVKPRQNQGKIISIKMLMYLIMYGLLK